jgi:hypothetical protein
MITAILVLFGGLFCILAAVVLFKAFVNTGVWIWKHALQLLLGILFVLFLIYINAGKDAKFQHYHPNYVRAYQAQQQHYEDTHP